MEIDKKTEKPIIRISLTQDGLENIRKMMLEGDIKLEDMLLCVAAVQNNSDSESWLRNGCCNHKRSLLHVAAFFNQIPIAQAIITQFDKWEINKRDDFGRTALDYAQQQGHTEIVELLQKHGGKEIDKKNFELLQALAAGERVDIEKLLEESAQVNKRDLDAWIVDNIKDLLRAVSEKRGDKLSNKQLANYYENILYACIRDYKLKHGLYEIDIEQPDTKEKMRQDKGVKFKLEIGDKILQVSIDDLENLIKELKAEEL